MPSPTGPAPINAITPDRSDIAKSPVLKKTSSVRLRSGAFYFSQQLHEFLFALGLIVPTLGLGQLRDVHRAELRSAHRAEFRFLVEVIGKIFVVHSLRGSRIERKLELLVPVEQKPRIGQRV